MATADHLIELADGHWRSRDGRTEVVQEPDGRFTAYDEEGWRFTTSNWANVVLLTD